MRIKRVLVPVDFSPVSRSALQKAAEIAGQLDAALDVLHVVDVPGGDPGRDLEHFVASVARAAPRAGLRLEQGDAPSVIARIAEQEGYDLIVMGTHGRSGVRRVILGSVAEEVVRQSAVPVLTVRAGAPVPVALVGRRARARR